MELSQSKSIDFSSILRFFPKEDRKEFGKFIHCGHEHTAKHIAHELVEEGKHGGKVLADFFRKAVHIQASISDPIFQTLMQGCIQYVQEGHGKCIKDTTKREDFNRRADRYTHDLAVYILAHQPLVPIAMAAPAAPAAAVDVDEAEADDVAEDVDEAEGVDEVEGDDAEAEDVDEAEDVEDMLQQVSSKTHDLAPVIEEMRQAIHEIEEIRHSLPRLERQHTSKEESFRDINEKITNVYMSMTNFLVNALSEEGRKSHPELVIRSIREQVASIQEAFEKTHKSH